MLQREDTLALDWDHQVRVRASVFVHVHGYMVCDDISPQVLEEEFDNRAFATEQHPSLLENAHVDNHPLSLVQVG